MQGLSFDNGIAMACAGASVLTGVLCLLCLVSLLSARSADAATERAAAFAVGLMALALSLGVLWSVGAAPAALVRLLAPTGLPLAVFQVQASIAAIVVAFFAWRFPYR